MNISFDGERLRRVIWDRDLNFHTLSGLSRKKGPYLSVNTLRNSVLTGQMTIKSLYRLAKILRYTEADLRRLIAAKPDR